MPITATQARQLLDLCSLASTSRGGAVAMERAQPALFAALERLPAGDLEELVTHSLGFNCGTLPERCAAIRRAWPGRREQIGALLGSDACAALRRAVDELEGSPGGRAGGHGGVMLAMERGAREGASLDERMDAALSAEIAAAQRAGANITVHVAMQRVKLTDPALFHEYQGTASGRQNSASVHVLKAGDAPGGDADREMDAEIARLQREAKAAGKPLDFTAAMARVRTDMPSLYRRYTGGVGR